jgi:D-psicose/D-tagatose/L-ribulose 3-epimerase
MTFDVSNLGVSSIGWEPDEDSQVSELLSSFGISNIDLTPSKYFSWTADNALDLAAELREFWESRNFRIRGVQSLLFGAPKWNILNEDDWKNLYQHFEAVFRVTEALGARFLVFGSPANRKMEGLRKDDAFDKAEEFFSGLAKVMQGRDLELTIEANPERYGCDFITSTFESAALVARIGSTNISSQLDLGTCLINSEDFGELNSIAEHLTYVHLSTVDLNPLHLEPNKLVRDYLLAPFAGNKFTIEQKSALGAGAESIGSTINWLLEQVDYKPGVSID